MDDSIEISEEFASEKSVGFGERNSCENAKSERDGSFEGLPVKQLDAAQHARTQQNDGRHQRGNRRSAHVVERHSLIRTHLINNI